MIEATRVYFSPFSLVFVEGLPLKEEAFIVFPVDNKNYIPRIRLVDVLILYLFFTADMHYKLRSQFGGGIVSHCRRYILSTLVLVITGIWDKT